MMAVNLEAGPQTTSPTSQLRCRSRACLHLHLKSHQMKFNRDVRFLLFLIRRYNYNFLIYITVEEKNNTFATGNRSLPLSPRRCIRLLLLVPPGRHSRNLRLCGISLDKRYIRIIEVEGKSTGHGYGQACGDNHRRGFPAGVSWILTRTAVDATPASRLVLSSATWSFGTSRPWSDVATDTGCLVKTLLARVELSSGGRTGV